LLDPVEGTEKRLIHEKSNAMQRLRRHRPRQGRISSVLAFAGCFGLGVAFVLVVLHLARRNTSLNAQSSEAMAPQDLLARLADLSVYRWSYRGRPAISHIGPMSQEFHRLFQVGEQRRIYVVDALGILFACIKALHEEIQRLKMHPAFSGESPRPENSPISGSR
jgi:hypothetical protein